MELGFFTMPIHPPGRNLAETLEEDRELVLLADALGFTEGYIGEHITDAAETITSALIFIAWLLRETKRIRLGTGTVNLPNHHPAMVAAEVAMVDHLAKGRFIFGISPGGLLSDAEVFGNLEQDRTAMFVEAINHILDIWANAPPYDLKGQFWTISTARTLIPELGQGVIAKPYQKPHPPIVVTAVAPFAKGVTAAAERGWDPISANFLQPRWVKTHWPNYVEGCAKGGRDAHSRTPHDDVMDGPKKGWTAHSLGGVQGDRAVPEEHRFDLLGALRVGMPAQHRLPRRLAQPARPLGRKSFEQLDHGGAVVRDQDLLVRLEECLDPRPAVGDQAGAGAGRLEQAGGWREAESRHARPIDVEDRAS
jgi:Luciferase-like monooxygenase